VFWPTLQCIGIAYLIGSFVTVREGLSYKLLNLGLIQWIGRLSYSLYIWQQLVMLHKQFRLIPDNWSVAKWLGSFPQNVVMAFVLATLSYYCLEKPFLSLKNRSAKNRQPKEKDAPVAAPMQLPS
jgi:peptidoglycan/LPS O-acetylase OafA/YrhL